MSNSTDKQQGGVGLVPMLIFGLVAALIAAGASAGSVYFLARRGIFQTATSINRTQPPPKLKQIPLEPMLVNLADESGSAYLRLGVVLAVPDAEKESEPKEAGGQHAEARDIILTVLGGVHSQELLAETGKATLKQHILEQLQKKDSALKVHDVYFTDFLVQR